MITSVNKEKNISEQIKILIVSDNLDQLKKTILTLHPADIAEIITHIDDNTQRITLYQLLDLKPAAEVLVELDPSITSILLNSIDETRIVEIIALMDSDDATEIVDELDETVYQKFLNAMPWEEFRDIKTLLLHDEETAGRIMALEIVAVLQNRTAKEALNVLRLKSKEVEDIYNIYLIDKHGILQGIVTLKDLVLSDPDTRLSKIMNKDFVSIHQGKDQEEVANTFRKYDLVAAPVVDDDNRLVGRITADDILEVIDEETTEDINLMAGIIDELPHDGSIFKLSKLRLPWLLVAFAGEMISAFIMSHFHASLDQLIIATFFIPLIMAMGGNTGIQSATIIIRGLATSEISIYDTKKRLWKELSVTLFNAIIISILLLIILFFIFNQLLFGLILSISLIFILLNAAFMGTIIPFLLNRFGIDPAVATGPFITTSNDIVGLLIYFSIMSYAMQWL